MGVDTSKKRGRGDEATTEGSRRSRTVYAKLDFTILFHSKSLGLINC